MFSLFRHHTSRERPSENNTTSTQGQVYQTSLKCFPISCVEGKKKLDNGDRVLLPESIMNILAHMEVSYPMTFRITNPINDKSITSGVMEFTAEENIIYMPYWMMEYLNVQDSYVVNVQNISIPKGTFIQFQPHKTTFVELSNPRVILETGQRNYTTLTKGTTIQIPYKNDVYYIDIVDTKPTNSVIIVETDMQVDFVPPKDAEEVAKKLEIEKQNRKREALYAFGQSTSSIPYNKIIFKDDNTSQTKDNTNNVTKDSNGRTETIGNFVYFYDAQGRLLRRIPKSQYTSSLDTKKSSIFTGKGYSLS